MNLQLNGLTALVTGASRGIGAATAVALAKAGASRVVLHYNSYRGGAEEALSCVRKSGADGELIQADLGEDAGIRAFLEKLAGTGAAVDILVNNAGSLVERARLAQYTPELFDRVINLNVKSAWFIAQAVASGMIERRRGFIVNVGSIAARNGGGIGATIYAGAKAAISAITKGLAKELAPHGVRVNAVSPGTVDNDFHARFSTRQILDSVVAATPAGKLGTNEEVADTIVFLCSDAARFIYGQTIEINGGMFMA
ncbi:MAG TPA: SDR family NAD(P)-dependent oxidoreductase [Bryobacteraceae bacterium]|nr:SDR family NAD(P)-dependent oxidoreductase [Bryobacteraceae bacterium]